MSSRSCPIWIAGVSMTKFHRPGHGAPSYVSVGAEAVRGALSDAGNVTLNQVDAAVASYCYGDPVCGQRVLGEVGLTGLPVFNTNNNCSAGSSAIFMAAKLIKAGYKAVLAFGFEEMERGLSQRYPEKQNPVGRHTARLLELGAPPGPIRTGMDEWTSDVIKMYGEAAQEYVHKYPQTPSSVWSEIAYKNHVHGAVNPRALFYGKPAPRSPADLEAPTSMLLHPPITRGMSTFTATGAAAALVVGSEFMEECAARHPGRPLVKLAAQAMRSDTEKTFTGDYGDLVGLGLARSAASEIWTTTGLGPEDVDILEVHDCFSVHELMLYEALGLCGPGKGSGLVQGGRWEEALGGHKVFKTGGRWVVNPSGGLESKGHPIGATGLGQCFELTRQLRGEAGPTQVAGCPRTALQHNFGLGSSCVVSLYTRQDTTLGAKL